VVRIVDERTLWLPDWRGNNRLDALRNIVEDGRVSLMFMIAGNTTVVRVNGTAILTADPTVTQSFTQTRPAPEDGRRDPRGRVVFPMRKGADARAALGRGCGSGRSDSRCLPQRAGSRFRRRRLRRRLSGLRSPRLW
jgi:hypothetical protein